jgi:biotin carboxylase
MQKKLFSKAGINLPLWTAGKDQIKHKRYKEDLVVKPVQNRGSRGIMRVKAGENVGPAINYALSHDPYDQCIVEEWIEGVQLSSESLVQDGKIIYTAFSERNYAGLDETYPYVIENGGDMPPSILLVYENDYQQKAEDQLQKCVDTMGLKSGTIKGDLVWDGRDIWVIEVACRLSGGSFCSKQIPGVWGVDFIGYAVRLALGERIYPGEINPYFRRYMSQRFVISSDTKSHPERGPGFIAFGQTREEAKRRAENKVATWRKP